MEMLRIAANDGIRVIAASAHMIWAGERVDPEMVRERVAVLNERVAEEGLDIRVAVGTEMRAIWDALMPLKHKQILTLDDSRCVLFEPPFDQLPMHFADLVFQVRMLGYVPLLAHPERCGPFLDDPDLFHRLVDEEMPLQITSKSLTGFNGERVQALAWEMMREERPIVISSDAHNTTSRPPILSEARAVIAERMGEETARIMCEDNPRALIENRAPIIAPAQKMHEPRPGLAARFLRALGRG